MAGQTLIPAGDFRTSYAADTTVFPTSTSRKRDDCRHCPDLLCAAHPERIQPQPAYSDRHFCHSRAGLNIVVRFTGQISIGHAAFFGFGAFTSAYPLEPVCRPGVLSHSAGGRGDGGGRLIFGLPAARLKGLYLAIATLAAQLYSAGFFARAEWFTGGSVPASAEPFSIFAIRCAATGNISMLCCLCHCLYLLVTNLMRSRDGRALIAIRDHYLSAEIMGINLTKYRTLSFRLAAFLQVSAVPLYAHYNQVVSNEGFASTARSYSLP